MRTSGSIGHITLTGEAAMRLPCRTIVAALLCCTSLAAVQAAEITVSTDSDNFSFIKISGTIQDGDSERFNAIAANLTGKAVIVLSSPGGKVIQAMAIGETIHNSNFGTAVVNDGMCASACALIWIAGGKRFVNGSSHVGFHAAYTGSGDDARETGAGNALVGAYLTKLGLSYEAILYATSKAPDDMQWLSADDARRLGIEITMLPDPTPARRQPQPAVAQNVPAGGPVERAAMNLVMAYYNYWSQSGTNVEQLAGYYNTTVNFFGANTPRSKVMDGKRQFAARWPIRHFTVQQNTLYAQCDNTQCSVSGVVQWDTSSVERNDHSVGSANFVVRISPPGVIFYENGSVLTGHKEPLLAIQSTPQYAATAAQVPMPDTTTAAPNADQQASSVTQAYADGRRDRIAYEQWFASLPEGSYRDGVAFWAGNRSIKPAPSCSAGPFWQQGCVDARARLTNIDSRRKADKDYWWGWNSL
jgi:hypothetical protein